MPNGSRGCTNATPGLRHNRMISEKVRSAPSRIVRIVTIVPILIRLPGVQQDPNIVPDRQIPKIPTRKGVLKIRLKRKKVHSKAGLSTIRLEAYGEAFLYSAAQTLGKVDVWAEKTSFWQGCPAEPHCPPSFFVALREAEPP